MFCFTFYLIMNIKSLIITAKRSTMHNETENRFLEFTNYFHRKCFKFKLLDDTFWSKICTQQNLWTASSSFIFSIFQNLQMSHCNFMPRICSIRVLWYFIFLPTCWISWLALDLLARVLNSRISLNAFGKSCKQLNDNNYWINELEIAILEKKSWKSKKLKIAGSA